MASSRVFLDSDVQETRFYLSWLNSNLDVANRVNAEVVTKPETATLGELFSYMNQTSAKAAWFECTATIDDVVHGSGWYYIGCGVCHTKATKGPTTLMCKKCEKSDILSVYDHNDQAIFVFLGDAGEELTGKKAVELVERYYQADDSVGEDHIVPVPQAMIDTIGQTRKFIVKVSNHNLTAKTQTLTVTKVLPLEAPEPEGNLGENVGEESYNEREDHADESVKRGADGIESEGVLSLSSMASSRVFLDSDVQETRFYLSWLNSNLDVANRVNVEVVTKPETATLGELFSYMNQASAKVAWFECTSTIDDVVHGSGWYYIGCGVCHTKATKGSTTLMCKKCGKSEIVGVAQYLSKLSAYDHNDQAVFVVLGDAGEELTGKKAAELVERYYQTRRFIVMVSNYDMTGKTQTLTVTNVLPLKAPEPEGNLGENVDEEPDNEKDDHADESVKRGADGIESEGIKRAKCG
ncbi:hypothetical protein F2Q70_00030603 [Brassica cretica]|uniref:Replication factor A C-terminal domain-containing protein n=1 Tax=Brassica cretica TaxID=69181 RepID=A0A8S9FI64_BRACR|nr:hypothetical protein F2Q70_00030603 [Brassica cretica]